MESKELLNILLICCAVFSGGVSVSLLSPFYPKEALAKGVSVTCSGVVIGSVFISTVIFTPIAGKYVMVLGTRNTLVYGFVNVALGNISFGFLDHIQNKNVFFAFSILIRVLTAMGESAIAASCFSLAEKQVARAHRGKVISVVESCFGIGTVFGPSLGGVLYDHGGFSVPFWTLGGLMLILSVISAFYLQQDSTELENPGYQRCVGWWEILKSPGVMISLFALTFSSMGCNWYSASLGQFLWSRYKVTSSQTGLVFMLFGITYTIFTPLFGIITDCYKERGLIMVMVGITIIFVMAALMGPIPQLSLVAGHLWVTVLAIGLQGAGSAASYLGSLIHMLSGIQEGSLPNTDQTKGMVSSLWIVAICLGGYLGSSLGGMAFDKLGFEVGSLRVTLGLGFSVLMIGLSLMFRRFCTRRFSRGPLDHQEEDKGLLEAMA